MRLGRLLRFGSVGVVNTAIYFSLYLLLHRSAPYLVAHLSATAIAMVCSYFLNCFLTFKVRPQWRTFLLFPLSNVANVVVTTLGLPIAIGACGLDERIAPLPVALVAIPVTYAVVELVMRAQRSDVTPAYGTPIDRRASYSAS